MVNDNYSLHNFMLQDEVELWLNSDDSPQLDGMDIQEKQETTPLPALVTSYLKFLFLWQTLFHLSDVGLGCLLAFIATFLGIVGRVLSFSPLIDLANSLPTTVRAARKMLGKIQDTFHKWVCCPACSHLYALDECSIRSTNGEVVSRECSFVRFPDHPQARFRKKCGMLLMKTVRTSAGTTYLYPRQIYCYKSVIQFLKEKMQQAGFYEQCEIWRTRKNSS